MTVYVDDAASRAKVGNLERTWFHLIADSRDELHAFAEKLGLKRSWFQDRDRHWHYDVTSGMRARALALGAQPVTSRDVVRIALRREQAQPEPVQEPTPEPEGELPGAGLADQWAAEGRRHWDAGRLAAAAYFNHACGQVDPSRADLWQSRRVRLLEAATRKSLAEANTIRLAIAGIGPDDPGVCQLREINEIARAKAPDDTQREAV